MPYFTKKAVTIEARQFETNNSTSNMDGLVTWMGDVARHDGTSIFIDTLEGVHRAQVGDWIIRGVKGEFYPCKPDIFDATYETAASSRAADRPKIITLCGSSRFIEVMAVCAWLLERDERAITMGLHLLPSWYPGLPLHHLAEHEGVAAEMDALHLHKVALADEIFVVDCNGYIGPSTAAEVAHAEKLGKPIRRYSTDPIGKTIGKMITDHLAANGGEG